MHNHEHAGFFGAVILHSLEELLSVLPFLFLAYLFMEFLEHKAGERMENAVRRAGRIGPLWGSLLGIVPQCGFSAAASGLYSGGVITLGTIRAAVLLIFSLNFIMSYLWGLVKFHTGGKVHKRKHEQV